MALPPCRLPLLATCSARGSPSKLSNGTTSFSCSRTIRVFSCNGMRIQVEYHFALFGHEARRTWSPIHKCHPTVSKLCSRVLRDVRTDSSWHRPIRRKVRATTETQCQPHATTHCHLQSRTSFFQPPDHRLILRSVVQNNSTALNQHTATSPPAAAPSSLSGSTLVGRSRRRL